MTDSAAAHQAPVTTNGKPVRPWAALGALVIGFFMIMIDTTIVIVANPSMQVGLQTDTTSIIWVTSAYLLTYSVPLLVTGRLGDRFGPRNLFVLGLAVFSIASLFCGLAAELPGSPIANLITARAVQGLGAALMAPQSMTVITRIFPPERRGAALGLWGATAGLASLVGPILGGVLVDSLGWEWIFYINVPIGAVAIVLAMLFVPKLETHRHRFDWLGVIVSCVGMFLLVFGLQQGENYSWNGWIIASIVGGVVVLIGFVVWQRFNRQEPLVPLGLFRDRNFTLGSLTMFFIGLSMTASFIPLIYFFQAVRGMTPTQSALMALPSAIATLALSAPAGRLSDRVHPAFLTVPGVLLASLGTWMYSWMISPDIAWGWLLIPSAVMGTGFAFTFGPIASTTTRNLPPVMAGAGSGVFNTVRQAGSVVGTAALAALLANRLVDHLTPLLPAGTDVSAGFGGSARVSDLADMGVPQPVIDSIAAAFTDAMRETMIFPAAAILLAAVFAAFFSRPAHQRRALRTVDVAADAPTPGSVEVEQRS